MQKTTYILLGTNLGKRELNLTAARGHIGEKIGTILYSSKIYETAAWGKEDQPDFLNQVIMLKTHIDPHSLLEKLLWIETTLGRQRKIKWGERIIDLDILFYEDEVINDENITIPHPGIPSRRFTLLPLQEIAPQLVHPVLNKTIEELLAECPDKLDVWPYVPS
ncbi:MAG: 2-amino-4-hydroxy-6-hydroxymethyldihydropteridine diphosphokinase [Cyclobacteriaceae bacterium]|jgi:2-amino-4-hydroxy-6-hydroxymethyldihydropteridine diphosphokinase